MVHTMAYLKGQELIVQLKEEHENIVQMFRAALACGVESSQGREMFKEAKSELLLHHEKEKKLVYQELIDSRMGANRVRKSHLYRNDDMYGFDDTMRMLHEFENELDSPIFFNSQNASTVCMGVVNAVAERVEFEESIIFLMYGKIASCL